MLTSEDREALGERVCWHCHDRDIWTAVERIVRRHRAEALREAAQAVDEQILDVSLVIGGASYMTYWLHDRADQIEKRKL